MKHITEKVKQDFYQSVKRFKDLEKNIYPHPWAYGEFELREELEGFKLSVYVILQKIEEDEKRKRSVDLYFKNDVEDAYEDAVEAIKLLNHCLSNLSFLAEYEREMKQFYIDEHDDYKRRAAQYNY